jgi:hypothetical protein
MWCRGEEIETPGHDIWWYRPTAAPQTNTKQTDAQRRRHDETE